VKRKHLLRLRRQAILQLVVGVGHDFDVCADTLDVLAESRYRRGEVGYLALNLKHRRPKVALIVEHELLLRDLLARFLELNILVLKLGMERRE
jgi:hypothetical protein